jgi:hypothetical protein
MYMYQKMQTKYFDCVVERLGAYKTDTSGPSRGYSSNLCNGAPLHNLYPLLSI